jgi:eukaryotic-like serine/threonine-protein kinase
MTTNADDNDAAATSAASVSSPASLIGEKIHKYEIIRIIGRGGMGTVYEAINTAISKRVAMKFVDAEMARNADAVARFQREAQSASAVESAHIVEIFDSGITDKGQPFIVMELLRGEDLGHRIKRCGRLDLGEAVHIIAQILRGLNRAHAAGIVHRDLKPDNIFLVDRDDDQNFAKILDFGISKVQRTSDVPVSTLTRQGTVLGTPFYMSPEQAQAMSDIDGRTDLWSVGAILYECLTGRPPYHGGTYEQVIINICMKDAEDVRMHNPGVTEGMAQVITKALCRERDGRFGSAREFLDAIASATGGLISSRPGRGSGDDLLLASARSSGTPVSGAAVVRPSDRPAADGFENTVEVHPAGTSKVGWSTSRRQAQGRDKRRFLIVGSVALAAGGLLALFVMNKMGDRASDAAASAAPAAAPKELRMQLKSSVEHPRFSVDGAEVKDGVLVGNAGERRHVRLEGDNIQPFEVDVNIGPDALTIDPQTAKTAQTAAPDVSPAGDASAASSAEPQKGSPVPRAVHSGRTPRGSRPEPPVSGAPAQTSPPASTGGVAGQLKLKTD